MTAIVPKITEIACNMTDIENRKNYRNMYQNSQKVQGVIIPHPGYITRRARMVS